MSFRPVFIALSSLCISLGALAQAVPDVAIQKLGPDTASAGSDVAYTITVTNGGTADSVGDVTINDNIPGSMTFVSETQNSGPTFICSTPAVGNGGSVTCDSASGLAAGASASFTFTFHIPGDVPAGTTYTNIATVTDTDPNDTNSEDKSSTAATTVPVPNADLGILKTGPTGAPANTDVAYTITLTNHGPNDATTVSWTDTLPSGSPSSPMTFVSFVQNSGPAFVCSPGTTTTCSIQVFPNGSTATFTLTGHIPNGTASGTSYTNIASVKSDFDPNPDNDSSPTTLIVSSADVGVTKSAPATAVAGTNFSYTITLSNSGPDTATDAKFSDTLPAGVTFVSLVQNNGPAASCNTGSTIACDIAALANAASAQFTVTVSTASTTANGTVITNTATASTTSSDTNPNNNTSSASTTINAQADVAITKTGPATVIAGNPLTYTITVTNNGPSAASTVQWTDTLPPGETFVSENQTSGPTFNCTTGATTTCSIASLAPGATATFTLAANVTTSVPNATTLSNTANVTTTTTDNTPGNNSSTASTTVNTAADVAITKTGPAGVSAGGNITYTITVTNNGPSDASTVSMTDTLPAGETFVSENQTSGPAFVCTTGATTTCNIGSLPALTSAVFSLTASVAGATPNGTVISNTANVTSTTPDTNPGNNSSTSSATVGANADLSVTKTASAPVAPAGGTATFTVTVTNGGPSTAAAVSLTDVVPANTTFSSAAQTAGPAFNCTTPAPGATGTITCTNAALASGASATFQFTFFVNQFTPVGTTISNTANVASPTPDPNPANNSATATITAGASIPLFSPTTLLLLALALGAAAMIALRR